MRRLTLHVRNGVGLHARPAAELAACASRFSCSITLSAQGGSCDAKSIFAILALDVEDGVRVTLVCDGIDEDEAAEALQALEGTI